MSFSLLSPTVLPARDYEYEEALVIPGLTRFDVALGRGTRINENPGNQRFRSFIGAVYHHYDTIKEGRKHLFAKEVTDVVLSQGRIVQRDETGNWLDAPYRKCIRKTQTLLRDYSLKSRRRCTTMKSLSQPRPVSPLEVRSTSRPIFDDVAPPLPLAGQVSPSPSLLPRMPSFDSSEDLVHEDLQDHYHSNEIQPNVKLEQWESISLLDDLDEDPLLHNLLEDSSVDREMLDSFVDAFSDDESIL